ncbi:MAG: MarR family transcriptional regulator [Firmicutes bacterium]|nr:MarR family transcriptional regulator [Bacillota bacterium]
MAAASEKETVEKMLTVMRRYPAFRNDVIKKAKFSYVRNEISPRQFHIMFCLKASKYRTITELARFMGISKSTLSIIMGKMIKKGYVVKTFPEDEKDKRKIYFELSDKGLEIFDKIKKMEIEEFDFFYSSFSEKGKNDIKTAFEYLSRVAGNKSDDFFCMVCDEYANDTAKIANNAFLFMLDFVRDNKMMTIEIVNELPENIRLLTKNQVSLLINIEVFKYNTISKLENFLNSSGSTVSLTVSKLVEKGYLYKEYPKGGDDGRVVIIRLTDKGKDTLREVEKIMKKRTKDYVRNLNENEREDLNKALDCLLDALEEVKALKKEEY